MRKRSTRRIRKALAIIAAAWWWVSWASGDDMVAVEEVHVVPPSETLWEIGQVYREKDSGRDVYLPEFLSEIMRLNPWLQESNGQISPGDTIKIVYYKKKEPVSDAAETDSRYKGHLEE